jgi:hypothetical protein
MSPAGAATGERPGERSLPQWAEQAEQAVRVLTHGTRPAIGELTDPADTAEIIAALAALTGMLPQLLDQLAAWLLDSQHRGQLGVDTIGLHTDAAQAVHAAAGALAHSRECAQRTASMLDTAHQHAAHLKWDER